MSEGDSQPQRQHVPLTVLPSSGKVEELKRQAAEERVGSEPAHRPDSTLIERFVDPNKTPGQRAIEERVIDAIKMIYDPEIPVNIYDLGLIYDIQVDPATADVKVKMTLTAPGCPVAGSLVADVERRVENIPEVRSATVELVWDPPWTRERMSEAAQLELGLL